MKILLSLLLLSATASVSGGQTPGSSNLALGSAHSEISEHFSDQELKRFAELDPIDAHVHVYYPSAGFYATLDRLNLHVLDIVVPDDTDPDMKDLNKETDAAWSVVAGSNHRVAMCTSFDPYTFGTSGFKQAAISKLNQDFARGAVAVKLYKNVGMEIRDASGKYIMADNAAFDPILKDIADHHKTLIAHLADPDSVWQAPNPVAPDYEYLLQHPELYMYRKTGAPTKAEILQARDRLLEKNTDLRVVGAHLGSMESNLRQLGEHLDRYPNFAVDLAARMPYFKMQPREVMIAFITKYQDRIIYGTDNGIYFDHPNSWVTWEKTYKSDWNFLATTDTSHYKTYEVKGLDLPKAILRKIYHENAAHWFPGLLREQR